MIRVLGLDPGLRRTGWGVIESEGNRLTHVAHGVITPAVRLDLPERLAHLFKEVNQVIQMYKPGSAAVEETFISAHVTSTLRLGMARGVVLMAPAAEGVPVGEYAANKIKKTLVGVGHAKKDQIMAMIRYLLPRVQEVSEDAADALAVAICHAHHAHHRLVTAAGRAI